MVPQYLSRISSVMQSLYQQCNHPKLLGGSVVSGLVATLPQLYWNFTFDNLFMSLNLLHHLSEHGFWETQSLMANRTDKRPRKDGKVIGKENRGSYVYRYDAANKLVGAQQNDNNGIQLTGHISSWNYKRYSRKHRKIIEVRQPSVVRYYNKHIGGVFIIDHDISFYPIDVPSKTWWMSFLCSCLNVAAQKVWLLH